MANLTEAQMEMVYKFREKQGKINKKQYLFYDVVSESFLLINTDKQTLESKKKETALRIISKNFKGINASLLIDEVPNVETIFNVNSNKVLTEDKETNTLTYNFFDEKRTQLDSCFKIREELGKLNDISFINKYKAFGLLFRNLFGTKKEEIEWVINYFSTIINTRQKVPVSIIIKGSQGSGKGLLETFFIRKVFSDTYVSTLSNTELAESRNDMLFNKMFVIFNEIEADIKSNIDAKVKQIVSDSKIVIRKMYSSPVEIENTFNIIFFSNKNRPLKVDLDDRRQSIFETLRNILEVIDEELGIDIEEFKKMLKEEFDYFLSDIKRYDYNILKTRHGLNNETKNVLARATTTKKDYLKEFLHKGRFDVIEEDVLEALELSEELDNKLSRIDVLSNLRSLKESMINGYLTSKDVAFLYNIFLKEEGREISVTKIGIEFNSLIGKSERFAGKKVRFLKNKYISNEVIEDEKDGEISLDGTVKEIKTESRKDIEKAIKERDDRINEERLIIRKEEVNDYTLVNNKYDYLKLLEKHAENYIKDYDFHKKGLIYFKTSDDEIFVSNSELFEKEDIDELVRVAVPF